MYSLMDEKMVKNERNFSAVALILVSRKLFRVVKKIGPSTRHTAKYINTVFVLS